MRNTPRVNIKNQYPYIKPMWICGGHWIKSWFTECPQPTRLDQECNHACTRRIACQIIKRFATTEELTAQRHDRPRGLPCHLDIAYDVSPQVTTVGETRTAENKLLINVEKKQPRLRASDACRAGKAVLEDLSEGNF